MRGYEHEIIPSAPTVIWVRRKGEQDWSIYMRCTDAEAAAEALRLLEQPMGIEAVLDRHGIVTLDEACAVAGIGEDRG